MFGTCAPQGTLTVLRGEEEGFVAFEKGQLRSGFTPGYGAVSKPYGDRRRAKKKKKKKKKGAAKKKFRKDGDPLPKIIDSARVLRALEPLDFPEPAVGV